MSTKKKTHTLRALKVANSVAIKSNKKAYIGLILLSLVMTVDVFVSLALAEYTVNCAYNLYSGKTGFKTVVIGMSLFAAAAFAFMLIEMCRRMVENKLMLDVNYYFENNLNSKLASIKWDYYESHDTYLKIHEVRTRTLDVIRSMISSTISYIKAVPITIILGYYLFQINIFAVLIYVVMVVIFNRSAGKMFDTLGGLWEEIQPYSQKQNYFLGMSGDKVTHQEFKFNRLYGFASKRWETLYNSEYKIRLKIFRKHEITMQAARIIFNIPYIAMLIIVAYEIAMGKHEIGFLFMANQLLNNVIDNFMDVQSQIADNRVNSRFVDIYDEVNNLEDAVDKQAMPVSQEINLTSVTYTYPQSDFKALDGLNFTIKNGEKIAVVGVNGSGKTTCTNILMSLTDNFAGSVTSAGNPISPAVSCILQDFAQYQMTVRENIEVGNSTKQFTDDEIITILDKVGLKEIILSFEKGINTPLGQLEDGIELSKGQWQKLAIARLLANPAATLWILDEPTAYLDPISEIEIYNMIYDFAGNRTVLFISHRLGFAKKADKIVLFDSGKITEQGTHDKLLAAGGIYAQMYSNQESWYV